jgi:hypothetical protein
MNEGTNIFGFTFHQMILFTKKIFYKPFKAAWAKDLKGWQQ